MNRPISSLPTTRREFLKAGTAGLGLLAFSRFAPSFLVQSALAGAPAPGRDRTILVLVQLAGGNDGLNTVVPFADPHYHRLRPTLALRGSQLLPLTDTLALNAACGPLQRLFHDGRLGIVQNVGYPNPNRSHFRSTEIWETGSDSDQFLATGWLGRYFDNDCPGAPGDAPAGVNVGNELPQAFAAARDHPTFSLTPETRRGRGPQRETALLESLLRRPADAGAGPDARGYLRHTMMDALVVEKRVQSILAGYAPDAAYPGTEFATSLRQVAALIAAGLPTRIYYVSLAGFDTHANQLTQQAALLTQLSEGLAAFQQDLAGKHLDEQVLAVTFSEFGRRPLENESKGTDHGTAAPLFVMGSRLRGGLHGTAPSLDVAPNQDLAYSTDFRAVYATLLDRWLGCDSAAILGQRYEPVGFL
jgi:uncharacterized protein (DUF1501 family)